MDLIQFTFFVISTTLVIIATEDVVRRIILKRRIKKIVKKTFPDCKVQVDVVFYEEENDE